MKKISYENLGKYFAEKASKEFGDWFSDDTNDWLEDIRQAESNSNYNEIEDFYNCNLEVTKTGFQPLLINFYIKYSTDNNAEYFID